MNGSSLLQKRWLAKLAVMIAVVGAIGFYISRPAESSTSNLTPTKPSHAPVRIHALGRLEPSGRMRVVAAPSGNEGASVRKLMVAEGDDVSPGQILAILDNHPRREAALAEAESRVLLAQAKLAQVRAGAKAGDIAAQRAVVSIAKRQVEEARRQYERGNNLLGRNAIAPEEIEKLRWSHDKAQIEFKQAEHVLSSIAEVRDTDVKSAEQEVAVAKAVAARAAADVDAATVRTPSAGRILALLTREGERITDQGLLKLGDVGSMHAVAEVFEADVRKVRLGGAAEVFLESTGERFPARVVEVGHAVARKAVLTNDPVSDTDARIVEVRVQLTTADSASLARLSHARVEVSIAVGE
ncbi:MAG: biotin/lipoyl-binding protein [Gemmataceae bacterium]